MPHGRHSRTCVSWSRDYYASVTKPRTFSSSTRADPSSLLISPLMFKFLQCRTAGCASLQSFFHHNELYSTIRVRGITTSRSPGQLKESPRASFVAHEIGLIINISYIRASNFCSASVSPLQLEPIFFLLKITIVMAGHHYQIRYMSASETRNMSFITTDLL